MTMHVDPGELRRKNAGARVEDHLELKSVMDALAKRDTDLKSWLEKSAAEIKDTGRVAAETKAALEKITNESAALADRILGIEQKMTRRAGGSLDQKSFGCQLTESADFTALQSKGSGTARLNIKASTITSATTDAAGSVGDAIRPDRLQGIITPSTRLFTIRDLLLPGRTSSNAVEFIRETGFTNAAAPVAEGDTKPQSDIKFDLDSTPVRTIAHWFAASKQVLSDVPMLQSYVDTRALYGLKLVEETQLLAGNGSGQNLHGLLPQCSLFQQTALSDPAHDTRIDTIRRAALQVRLAEYRPTFVVLNPTDWAAIELTKDEDGRYLWVNVQVGGTMQVWRLAVVETTAIDAGEFLVGATMGAQVFDREEAAVEVSTEHADFFVKNLVAIRAEERLALTVTRPESFVRGHFDLGGSPTMNG